ncbi:MAG: polysaccharide biosynthesis C-terminal domain-containing protein, partial [Oscillospiraceae bacterium]|nr:polysaccharide biosynthesis C-terminal domain-containing protein [Oscillospiraceae bacterium]
LYKSRAAEVSVCLDSFVILCLGGIFMTASSALFAIFQSIGKARVPLILMSGSIVLKFVLNPLLISIPSLNIAGAALSSVIGYIIMTIGGTIMLKKSLPVKIGIFGAVFPPFICACGCGAGAYFVHQLLENHINSTLNVIFSTISGAVIYAILLILTGCFRTSGIRKANFAKKTKKPLAK